MTQHAITVAYGDGIGPEIMEAVLYILKEAKAPIHIDTVEIGKKVYEHGHTSGIAPASWETIKRNKVLLKAPITTPQGGGYKSLNVTLRRALGLYANVRPCVSYAPFVPTQHPDLDVIVVRENEEDIYTGIEHRPTREVCESLKIITRAGSQRIARYAFDLARKQGRKRVSCFSKDNIMKMSDGLFHRCFNEVASLYEDIKNDHFIVDIGTARLASKPNSFDVIVTENLYGDIISDVVAEVSGSVGLAGSSNIGEEYAMFEAVHGSAPDIAGQDIANPSGLLQAAVLMLLHLGENEVAGKVQNAWLRTLEDGIHTADIYTKKSAKKAGTRAFAEAVVERLGKKPKTLSAVSYATKKKEDKGSSAAAAALAAGDSTAKQRVGVDVFFDFSDGLKALVKVLEKATSATRLKVQGIDVKGMKVWPGSEALPVEGDYWRARFVAEGKNKTAEQGDVLALLAALDKAGLDIAKSITLYTYGDALGFTLTQGE